MKGTDRYLVGFVGGIVLLVVVAIIIVLLRTDPEYRLDDSPEATVHNYLLALKEENFERAHSHLSPNLDAYPEDVQDFARGVRNLRWQFGQDEDSILTVNSSFITGDNATVEVNETIYYSGGLFDSGQSSRQFEMELQREVNMWKLVHGERYWDSCWSDTKPSQCSD